jgi:signal recognition particle subunit SRP54
MVEQVKEKIEDMEKEDVDQINKNIDDLFSGDFTLQSLCDCMNSINKIGSIEKMMKFIPGIPKISEEQVAFQKEIQKKIRAMISSMTERERKNPAIIDASRKKRISKGSGTSVSDVNNMLKQFGETKKLLKKFTGGKKSLFNFFK